MADDTGNKIVYEKPELVKYRFFGAIDNVVHGASDGDLPPGCDELDPQSTP